MTQFEKDTAYLKEFFTSLQRNDRILSFEVYLGSKIIDVEMYKYIKSPFQNQETQKLIHKGLKGLDSWKVHYK